MLQGEPEAEPPALCLTTHDLPGEVLRTGVDRRCYRWWPDGDGGGPGRLLLGPDADDAWWVMGACQDRAAAARAADVLRAALMQVQRLSEGLHVVEHVLLRPRGAAGAAAPPGGSGFYPLRVTVVFPIWTARTALAGFRRFAEEAVRINTPAHLAVQCQWLPFDLMLAFEADLLKWRDTLGTHLAALPAADATDELDAAAAKVVAHLLRNHGRGAQA
jgi:hypothetical protein